MTWAAIAAVATVVEIRAIRRHRGTLSQHVATLSRTETTIGKVAFTVALVAGSAILWRHIVTFEYSQKAAP